ncbi:MAG: FemAB family PEP-CTERM system-associated protein [Calditrichaeota bacterium]|nr:FemAB family PEP-CTERM system-associated protein [Calditrichota bacterium]
MKIQRLTKETEAAWDQYVLRHPHGNFYQLSGWQEVYASVFQFVPQYYFAVENSRIVGVLPLILMRNILGKPFLVSTPFSSYGGVCFDTREAGQFLLKWAKHLAAKYGVQYVEFRQYEQTFGHLPQKDVFVRLVTKLSSDPEELWKHSLKPKIRRFVRQGEKKGLYADWGHHYLNDFYRIFTTNMKRLGTPAHPIGLFGKLIEKFGDQVKLLVVKYEKRVIGGMFMVDYAGRILTDPWVSSLSEFNHLRPNHILYWNALKYGCENGYDFFDFGRSTQGTGTYEFKKPWGAEALVLPYEYYLHKAGTIPEVDANNNKYEFLISVWKKLPLPLATAVGKRVVKFLPEL